MARRDKPKGKGGGARETRRWTLVSKETEAPPTPPPHERFPDLEMPSVFAMERTLREVRGGGGGRRRSPPERAQDLFYEASEAARDGDVATAIDRATRAIGIHPYCVDALMLLLDLSGQPLSRQLEIVRDIVRAGEEDLGPAFFEENRGQFWLMIETRPYMRARQRLAEILEEAGRQEESAREYEALLDLNPGDNQGVRYSLVGCYLLLDCLEDARRLLDRFPDEGSAMWAWARVLERHLSGDLAGAGRALRKARKANRFAEAYLAGSRRVPGRLPEYYAGGQESEGVVCGDILGAAWRAHPESIAWLGRTP